MTTPAEPLGARELAARVAARTELLDVRLLGSHFDLDRVPDLDRQLSWTLDVQPSTDADATGGTFVVNCDYELTIHEVDPAKGAAELNAGQILSMTCRFAALYELEHRDGDPAATAQELEAFAATTGAFALYPYARAYIQDVTVQMGLPGLTLSVYKVPVKDPSQASSISRRGTAASKPAAKKVASKRAASSVRAGSAKKAVSSGK